MAVAKKCHDAVLKKNDQFITRMRPWTRSARTRHCLRDAAEKELEEVLEDEVSGFDAVKGSWRSEFAACRLYTDWCDSPDCSFPHFSQSLCWLGATRARNLTHNQMQA